MSVRGAAVLAIGLLAAPALGQVRSGASGEVVLAGARVRATIVVRDGRLAGERVERAGVGVTAPALDTDGGFRLAVAWTGWDAPGKANNADNECEFTAADFRLAGPIPPSPAPGAPLALAFEGPDGLGLEVRWEIGATADVLRRRIRVFDPKGRNHLLDRLWTLDAVVRTPARVLKAGGFGQPVALAADNTGAFLGLEWPAADNRAAAEGGTLRVRCGEEMGELITTGGVEGESVAVGVTPDERVKLHFDAYLDTIRAGRLRPYTLYNSWYDLRAADYPRPIPPDRVMNEANVRRIASLLRADMVERHGITLDAFVLDDGWDVYASDWVLRPEQFPHGLAPIAAELAATKTRLGMWLGPTGGYSARRTRVDWMRAHGYETVGDEMWVGGPRYSALLEKRLTDLAKGGVAYFKLDGFQFVASGPGLGTPPGIYSRRAVLRTVARLAAAVRGANPDMFLNITSGTWLSPWWLLFADQIWMSGEDYGEADVPSISTRDSSITYRDLVLHEDFAKNAFWFPLANLMTHGILKGTIDVGDIGKGEPLSKFADEVAFYLARGVTMHELYISPDALSEGEWRVLADALRWARGRFDVLRRTEMVGGDPGLREPYGYVHFRGREGIVAVRNPDVAPAELQVLLDPAAGLDPFASGLVLERVYPTRWVSPRLLSAGERVTLPLSGYEAAIYEVRPLADVAEPLLADAVFETGPAGSATVLEAGAAPAVLNLGRLGALERDGRPLDPAALRSLVRPPGPFVRDLGSAVQGGAVTAKVAVAPDARSATLAVLLRADAPGKPDPRVSATLDGAPVRPEVVAVKGVWAWHTVAVGPGEHLLRLGVTAGDAGAPWSGTAQVWATGSQAVPGVEVALRGTGPAPPRPLPATGRGPRELPRSVRIVSGRL